MSTQQLIECNALSKRYGKTQALDNVSLTLDAGAPIALIGPNGAGKTTLLSLLCGFIKPSSGSVSVHGYRPGSNPVHNRVSALPQDAWLDSNFPVHVQLRHYAQLQGMSKKQSVHETARVLELVQLADRSSDKPDTLSHGMRKRVLIAQALIGKPELILLDEPTAGLDPPNVKIIRELIAAEAPNATFIISSHNLDELEKVCTSVVHLNDGRLRNVAAIDDSLSESYLTVTLKNPAAQNQATVLAAIRELAGVDHVDGSSSGEYVIAYQKQEFPQTDLALLTLLANRGYEYKKLIKGRTLEDQLFTE